MAILRNFQQLVYLAILVGGAICQPWVNSTSSCPSSFMNFYLNIFNEITSNHHDLAERLNTPPLIQGTDTSIPAFEFAGHGSGFSITTMSDRIQKASCLHNEITFSGRVYIRDSQSDGPLLELVYSGGLESGQPLYILHMDAAANEIILTYQHAGLLHSEIIPIRLISGRWRHYSVSLSGNLLSFYFDCQLETQRLVSLPDYCHNESSVMVNVASSVSKGLEFSGETGLYVYVQNLVVEFGPGGVARVCPKTKKQCPTCGQFLSYLEKLTESEQTIRDLKHRVNELEEGCVMKVDPEDLNCVLNVGEIRRTILNMNFLLTSSRTICYCDNGESVCTTLDDSLFNSQNRDCEDASTGPQMDTAPTAAPGERCRQNILGDRSVAVGEAAYILSNNGDFCAVHECRLDPDFGPSLLPPRNSQCDRSVFSSCSDSFSATEINISFCCGICNECHFHTCAAAHSICKLSQMRVPTCECVDGYTVDESGICLDVDECAVGRTQGGHNCLDFSSCTNTVGSFTCTCFSGYTLKAKRCEDINECTELTHNCSSFSVCENTNGSFNCTCDDGYAKDGNGVCQPVCVRPCLNRGTCVSPNNCSCQPGFIGSTCHEDLNECSNASLNICMRAELATCVNTIGGYFCRCVRGYLQQNEQCVDVDECSLKIHNCIGRARCVNTIGSYQCLCKEKGGTKDCTGSCVRRGIVYADHTSFLDRCVNCTCLSGELRCLKVQCDCSSNVSKLPAMCCTKCSRKDCIILGGSVHIRPGSSWVNPSNRCERYDCLQNQISVRVNISHSCPPLDCPMKTVPAGKCCPVCLFPTCDASREGRIVSLQNGCKVYTCMNSVWNLTRYATCSTPSCQPQDVVFFRNGCCPVCRNEILGTSQTQCSRTNQYIIP